MACPSVFSSSFSVAKGVLDRYLCVCQHVALQVCTLRKLFRAIFERAYKGSVARVGPHVSSEVEIEGEPLAASFVAALKRFLSGVNQRMPLEQ